MPRAPLAVASRLRVDASSDKPGSRLTGLVVGAALIVAVVVSGLIVTRVPGWNQREVLIDYQVARSAPAWVVVASEVLALVFAPVAMLVVTLGVAAVIRSRRGLGEAATFLLVALAPMLTAELIKAVVQRPAPALLHSASIGAEGWSYPSGHAAAATAFGLAVVCRVVPRSFRAPGLVVVACISAATAVSRVVLVAHYPTDTVAGILVAVGGFLILQSLVEARRASSTCSRLAA